MCSRQLNPRLPFAMLLVLGLLFAQGPLPTEAFTLPPAHLSAVAEAAECSPSSDGTARYFVSVQAADGTNITTAIARLVGAGTSNAGQVVVMSNGDLESAASDGRPPSCRPAATDGHANDLGTTFVAALAGTDTWTMIITAAGYSPLTLDLASAVDGTVCPLGDNAGCLISVGTVSMTRSGGPSPTISGAAGARPVAPPASGTGAQPSRFPAPPAYIPAPNVWGPAPPIVPVFGPPLTPVGAPADMPPPALQPRRPLGAPLSPGAPIVPVQVPAEMPSVVEPVTPAETPLPEATPETTDPATEEPDVDGTAAAPE